MSGRFGKCVAVALVALATMAVPATANADRSMRPAKSYPTLKNCSIFADGANRAFHNGAQGIWRSDPGSGGCIETAQRFITDSFRFAKLFAVRNAAIRTKLSGLDLGWWPLRLDGDFGENTKRAVTAYRRFEGLTSGSSLGWLQLDHMATRCGIARRHLGYQTSACAIPRPGRPGPN